MGQYSTSISGATATEHVVNSDLFGGNFLYATNKPTEDDGAFEAAIESIGIDGLRFPAGKSDKIYKDGLLDEDGELLETLVADMDWMVENGHSITFTTPIRDEYSSIEEFRQFIDKLVEKYGDHIKCFEIGNEYFGSMDESDYGKVADAQILEISDSLGLAGQEADIAVQMGHPFGSSSHAGTFNWKAANLDIIAELSPAALDQVDGVVEHYYYNKQEEDFSNVVNPDKGLDDAVNFINRDLEIWEDHLPFEPKLYITEWNIKSSNLDQQGMKAASTLLEQFEYLQLLGTDVAHVWPIQHNTSNDVAGHKGEAVREDEETGIAENSIQAAAFDMITSSLSGMTLLDVEIENDDGKIEVNTYASENKVVMYISSRSEGREEVELNIEDLLSGYNSASGILLGYDQSTANGRHYDHVADQYVDSDYVMIDGDRYYLNEHDVEAEVTGLHEEEFMSGSDVSITLDPFEVFEITFDIDPEDSPLNSEVPTEVMGTTGDDMLTGTQGDDIGFGLMGDDWIKFLNGDDRGEGNTGDDGLFGGAGRDTLSGNDGSDTLEGGMGNDNLFGGIGEDLLHGGAGHDTLRGGSGDDVLLGRLGSDVMFGGDGSDRMLGGSGNDTLNGNGGADWIRGDFGDDRLVGKAGTDLLKGGSGDDTLIGGMSADTLMGGAGRDELEGGFGRDVFSFSDEDEAVNDRVLDFELGRDTIRIESTDVDSATDISVVADVEAAVTYLLFGQDDESTIELEGLYDDDDPLWANSFDIV